VTRELLFQLSIQCRTKNSNDIGIRAIFGDTDTQFQQLLRKYPDVIRPTPKDRKVKPENTEK
jgi:hypothetical protein